MAPTGAVGLAGVVGGPGLMVDGGAAVGLEGRDVGNVGSVGPAPGDAMGRPSMVVLHPATSALPASAAKPHRAFCDKRTPCSPNSPTTVEIPEIRLRTGRRKLLQR